MAIDHGIQSIRRNRKAAYAYEVNPSCGAVSVGQNGERVFVYGLLKEKDSSKFFADPAPACKRQHGRHIYRAPATHRQSRCFKEQKLETAARAARREWQPVDLVPITGPPDFVGTARPIGVARTEQMPTC